MLSNIKLNTSIVEVEHPKFKNFKINLVYVNREDIAEMRKLATKIQYNPVTKQREEMVDPDIFLEEYVRRGIKGWSGLTLETVTRLVPIDTNEPLSKEIPYSEEDALWLVKNSPEFDSFFSSLMSDVDVFSKNKKEAEIKKSNAT